MLHGLLDFNILVFMALIGVLVLAGEWVARYTRFFRELIDARLADPRYESHLEGLRGVLAFGVYIHHAAYTWESLNHGGWYERAPASHFMGQIGGASVAMFFFLTGYLFWGAFLRRGAGGFSIAAFYRKRLLRIGPAYWLFCVVMLLIVMLDSGGALRTTALEGMTSTLQWLAFGVPLGHFPDINGYGRTRLINADVAWSLRHEALFYLLLPFLLPFAQQRRTLLLVVLFAVSFVVLKQLDVKVFQASGVDGAAAASLRMWLNDGLIEFNKFLLIGFVPGMLTAYALHRPGWRLWVARIQTHHAIGVLVVCVLFLLLNTHPKWSFLRLFPLWAIFFLIAAQKVGARLLRTRGLMVMGLASYSVYVFHGVFLFLLEPQGWGLYKTLGAPGQSGFWVLIGCLGLVTLAVSALVYRFLEFPCLHWGQRDADASPHRRL